jgi:hypothetical protein
MTKNMTSFICCIMMFNLLQSCKTDDNLFDLDSGRALDLRAPNGEQIADNISSFKEEVSFVIENIYGERKEFEIVKLEFIPDISKGYVADIEYETYDGIRDSYFKVHGLEEYSVLTSGMLVMSKIRLKNGTESGETSGGSNYYCKKSSNNLCNKCRKVQYNISNVIQITCVCDEGLTEGCNLHETTW